MMWLRRVFALILALIFVILFLCGLVVFRVNSTAGNPRFYINQLRHNDIYSFVYDDVLPAAIDDLKTDADIPEDFMSLFEPRIVPLVEQAIPREWVQAQVEHVIREVFPYFLGDTRDFRVEIPLRERVIALSGAINDLFYDNAFFSEFYDCGINYLLDENESNLQDLPFTREELIRAVNKALPPQWISTQLNRAIDEVTLYLTGDASGFNIHLEVTERLDDLEMAVIDLLGSQETYDYVFDELLTPTVEQYVSTILDLPVETILTVDEIVGAAKIALTPEWYRGQVDNISGQVFSYLKANTQYLELLVPLADRKPILISELAGIVNRKLGEDVSPLVLPVITDYIDNWIPDRWSLDEVLAQVSEDIDIEDEIGKIRDDIDKGFGYTDSELRSDMKDDFQTVEDIREKVSLGFVFTEQDLRDQIDDGNDATLDDLDNVRSILGTVRRWMWVFWILPALLLAAIGALGARKWTNKLIWGASVLAAASVIVIVLSGPVYSALAKPEINQAITGAFDQTSGLEKLVTDKVITLSQNTVNAAVHGLVIQGIIMLVVSLAVIAFAIIWNRNKAGAGPVELPAAD